MARTAAQRRNRALLLLGLTLAVAIALCAGGYVLTLKLSDLAGCEARAAAVGPVQDDVEKITAVLPDLAPQRLSRHQECARETVRCPFRIHLGSELKHHMAELVGEREPLPLPPILLPDHDDRNCLPPGADHSRRQAADLFRI